MFNIFIVKTYGEIDNVFEEAEDALDYFNSKLKRIPADNISVTKHEVYQCGETIREPTIGIKEEE